MKALRFTIALCLFGSLAFNNANTQSVSTKDVDVPWNIYIDCAGETITGTLTLHIVVHTNKAGEITKVHHQPMGGELIGEISGDVYRPTGVTQTQWVGQETYVNRYHMVGPGTQYYVKEFFHVTLNAAGEVVVVIEKYETICK